MVEPRVTRRRGNSAGVVVTHLLAIPVLALMFGGCSLPNGDTRGTDNCKSGYGYFDTSTGACYAGSGPGASNGPGNGVGITCPTGYPFYNADSGRCSAAVPGTNISSGVSGNNGARAVDCVISNDGSDANYDYHRYVDRASSAPCWGHETFTLCPGGHYWYDFGGPYSNPPSNIWNIDRWGYGRGTLRGGYMFHTDDGHTLIFSCASHAAIYPQTTHNSRNWS